MSYTTEEKNSYDQTNWKRVGPLSGTIHAEMVGEVLKERDIPYYVSQDWFSGALGIKGVSAVGNTAFIFVPEEFIDEVNEIIEEMFGEQE